MAKISLGFDPNSVETRQMTVLVAPGLYVLDLVDVQSQVNEKSSEWPQAIIVCPKIVASMDGLWVGARTELRMSIPFFTDQDIEEDLRLSDTEKEKKHNALKFCKESLAGFLKACSIKTADFDTYDLQGKRVVAKVEVYTRKPWEKEDGTLVEHKPANRVQSWAPLSEWIGPAPGSQKPNVPAAAVKPASPPALPAASVPSDLEDVDVDVDM